ncbi:DUF924 family protein [Consotaella salsifontis]|uniref:Uncharacterized conserved protein, DUF924 family n=1 Tax=Consotaella salsifontis TaxID=1365950 RepID=A0A1T4MZ93_9HYPH|nr:DUF924 family protein [Consotaella salsifontis]SJZ71958.1 Uncharacterized conserved protein, DUF924 family [Consotaella salsifontis]
MTGQATPLTVASAIVTFWRGASDNWFVKDDAFDADFRSRFSGAHWDAAARRLDDWMATAEGALALVVLLDQFPRNAFRGTAHMFATDPLARHFAAEALDAGYEKQVEGELALFFCLPFMHSEDIADQRRCVDLVARIAPQQRRFADEHLDIIARFGRFPHRNAVLGRETTAEEAAFLSAGGFAG